VLCGRNSVEGDKAVKELNSLRANSATFVRLDLSDLNEIKPFVTKLAGRKFNCLIANAGVAPSKHSTSSQGFELAYAVNCLGHHALIKAMDKASLLVDDARIVILTG
jgi:NAD(P)-dependent dehydrogenase (short-subunit alcohol dehydrogenase family)